MVVYGNLTKQKISFDPVEFHWSDKQIVGLMMFRWVCSLSEEERVGWFKEVATDIANGGKIFGSKVVKKMPLKEWRAALDQSEKEASHGKYVIDCLNH